MKKNLIRVFACVMAAAAIMTLTASGNDKSSPPAESSEAESSAATDLPTSGKFATIDEFVNSSIMQSQIKTLKDSAGDSGMDDITLAGEGNKLIYTFTFAEGTETEGMAEALEAALDTQASTFENVASSLKAAVEVEDPIVVVTYADSEGNEIYSREFTAAE